MRIHELHLTRYGRFSDRVLDFGPARPGKPDLHIVYGPNEAGKSTLVSAWLDLLFGIEQKTRYAFLHPGPNMRIGAALDIGDRPLRIARVKRREGSLLDAHDTPLPEAAIQSPLGGLTRDAYCAMFSLDDDTLKAGGDSILDAKGDLGQLLFSSSAGLAGLSGRLSGLRDTSDRFFRPRATSTVLAELKRGLDANADERRAIDVTAPDHRRLTDALTRAEATWQAARSDQTRLTALAARLDRTAEALPLMDRLAATEAALAALPDLPQVPATWPAEAERLESARTQAASQAGEVARSLAAVDARIAELRPDPAILALADRIAAIGALRSGHDEAVKDLPARHDERSQREVDIAAQMQRLGASGTVADALIPVTTMAGLRRLVEARSGVAARLAVASAEAEVAHHARIDAEARARAAGPSGAMTERLALLLARLRGHDPDATLRQARTASAQAATALAQRIAALAPWHGTPAMLMAVPVPPPARLDAIDRRITTAGTALREAGAVLTALHDGAAEPDAGPEASDPATDDLATTRALRERLWAAHLATLTAPTAEAFEIAMRRDDRLAEAQARAGAEDAVRAQAHRTAARHAARLLAASDAADAARTEADAATADLRSAIQTVSLDLPPDLTLTDLRDWLARREAALLAIAAETAALTDEAQAKADLQAAADALRQALDGADAVPDAMPYALLSAHAQTLADAGGRASVLLAAATTAQELERRREADLTHANAADQAWRADWAQLCGPTCLVGDAGDDTDASARALDVLDALRPLSEARDALAQRTAKMEANRAAFRAGLAALAADLGLNPDDSTATWDALTERLDRARTTKAALAVRQAERDTTRTRHADLLAEAQAHQAALDRIAATLGVDGFAALHDRLALCAERDRLLQDHRRDEGDLIQRMRTATLDEARAQLRQIDLGTLDDDRSRVGLDLDHARTTSERTYAEVSAAQSALRAIGDGDDAARLEEHRQTLLLEVQEGATAHLRRRFGILALDHALRAYRDRNRSAMMTQTSQAFRTISRDAYTGVDALSEGDREILIAKAADGSTKQAVHLSKGTQFQLYLALRVAGYHVLAQARTPVPFIADDIMETFDDDRSSEAFRLLADMARVGQVIYLTHHRHLCDIARAICPDAVIHDLIATD